MCLNILFTINTNPSPEMAKQPINKLLVQHRSVFVIRGLSIELQFHLGNFYCLLIHPLSTQHLTV